MDQVSPGQNTEPSGGQTADDGLLVSRRSALIGGVVGVGGLMVGTAGGLEFGVSAADAALPTTTAPEQLRLEWGSDPATEMTVSWSTAGTVPAPAPMLAYSTSEITDQNPGALVMLPKPEPLDLTEGPRTERSATSFFDGQTGQTIYHYHVPLAGLKPDTTYYYQVSDGAGNTAGAQFRTAPTGRASFRFTAFGDQGVNAPSPLTTQGVMNPGDGAGAPLFHLMVGDLAYADGSNPPSVWRSWALMVQPATSTFPWMPVPGNHELEPGVTDIHGVVQTTGLSGSYYNGPYGIGDYLARHLLPDNGLTNWDGNSLQGNFYSFQIGTVLFICLAGNDVLWQTSDFSQTNRTMYTGDLKADPDNMALVPDDSNGTPNLQVQWLEDTLAAARAEGSGVEMVVVQFHFPLASVDTGNSCDMGIRTAFGPLFDKYQVDLTLAGHNHNYCRSLPVRGYDPPSGTTEVSTTNPFGTYAPNVTIDTRRPSVQQTEPVTFNGQPTFDTSLGTIHLVVGGGGAGSTIGETFDVTTGLPQAHPFAAPAGDIQALEDAPWLGYYDTVNAYGYAVFDVDPGDGPGQTSITFQWFSVPSGGPLPTAPLEKFTFARMAGQITAGNPEITGTVAVGRTVTADAGSWSPASVTLSYQWLADGSPISGATDASYTLSAADEGQELQVQVTGSQEGFATTSATSPAAVVAGGELQPAVVTVSGSVAVGGTVTASATPWTPPATLSYQWLLNGNPISGATGTTYSPVAADAGKILEVQVTGTAPGYKTASTTSVPQTVAEGTGSSVSQPAMSADPTVGATVTATLPSGSSGAGQLTSYQWLLNGAAISGATSGSYTPVPADAGRELQVKVTAPGRSVISKASGVKATKFATTSRPGLRGRPAVGQTLTAVTGRWSPSPAFEYQWLRDGHPIKGATHQTLELTAADAGRAIALKVTAKRTGYFTHETVSDAVKIGKGQFKASRPRITGRVKVGQTLHVEQGEWDPKPDFGYRWLVNGREVRARKTGHSYKVRPEDRGKRITVEVTGRLPGYEPATRLSHPTVRAARN